MSLKNLIKEAETEQYEFKTRLRYRKVNDRIADFVFYLSNEKELKGGKKGLEFETLRGYICTIKAIYHSAGIDLGPVALPKSDKNKAFEKLISYEEIRTVVKSATQRERAIFTTHLSSGMGMSEVRSLKYGDFLRALEKYTETDKYFSVSDLDECLNGIKDPIIPIWKMRRVKTDYPYISFTSPEATRETMLYLMERENGKFPIESKRDVLFATKTTGGMISEREYADLFERSNDKHNLGRKLKNNYRRFQSHELRRYFSTECMVTGIDSLKRNFMIGHSIDKTQSAYYKAMPEDLLQEYRRVLPRLTFDKVRNITIEDPEVAVLRKELVEAQKQRAEMAELLRNSRGFEKQSAFL